MSTLQHLERVAPLGDHFFSIHRKIKLGNGKIVFPGHAHKFIDDAVQDAHYHAMRGSDTYISMCGQKNIKAPRPGIVSRSPFPDADRTHANAIAAKNLYLDVDVKPDELDKAYASSDEAMQAIYKFVDDAQLMDPTVIVSSGTGGYHVYWTFPQAITLIEWQPLANALASATRKHQLKCDAQCTVDATRLLRVAGTWNYKREPPLPVELVVDSGTDIEPVELLRVLGSYVDTPRLIHTLGQMSQSKLLDGMKGAIVVEGAAEYEYPPSDIDVVAEQCPFIKETLRTGGEGYDEPLWKYTISLAARCKDPEQTAHRLSSGHATYDPTETLDKLAQAQTDRRNNSNLGPPGCEAIHHAGATQCSACPHLALKSNPLNVGFKRNGHAHPAPTVNNNDLPYGYYRGKDGHIFRDSDPDDNGVTNPIECFPYPILYNSAFGEAHSDRSYRVCFDTLEAGTKIKRVELDYAACSDKVAAARALFGQGLSLHMTKPVMEFLVAYLTLLRGTKTTLVSVPPVGWFADDGAMGFAYDGVFYSPKGEFQCHRMPVGSQEYTVVGEEQPWRDLAQAIITPDRPDIAVLAAAGFAGPLVFMTGQKGFLLGCWSSQSGVGKTTALTLAQSVWGSPVGMQGMTDTLNYVFTKVANVKHLPVIYDEVKSIKQVQQFVDLTGQLTHGRDKGRARQDGQARPPREWLTLIAYAVNAPLAQAVQEANKGTDASLFRMFEYQALTPKSGPYTPIEVGMMSHRLEANYGHIGKAYAKFLGENYELVQSKVTAMQTHLQRTLPMEPDQRFWIAGMAAIMTGAALAKALGFVDFPLPEMMSFLTKEYHRMRTGKMAISQDFTHHVVAGSELAAFIRHKLPKNCVRTDIVWTNQGRPPLNAVKLLNDAPGMSKEVMHMQIAHKPDPVIRIVDRALASWCKEQEIPKLAFIEALKNHYGASVSMGRIGSGTKYSASTLEPVWTICVKGTPLEHEIELPD